MGALGAQAVRCCLYGPTQESGHFPNQPWPRYRGGELSLARGSPWPCLAPAPAVSPLAGGQHRRQVLVGSRAVLGVKAVASSFAQVCVCMQGVGRGWGSPNPP